MKIGQSLRALRENLELTQAELAKKSGISKRSIQLYENDSGNITIENLRKLSLAFDVDISYFFTDGKKKIKNDFVVIDIISIKASAGTGVYNYDIKTIGQKLLDLSFFKTNPNPNDLKIIEVYGDSMEPTIINGALVVVDIADTNRQDGIYALEFGGQVLIKRLQFNLDGTIEIISDNKLYATQHFDPKENQTTLNILGKKVLTIG